MGKAFKLRNGMLLVSTEAPGGIYNSAQLAAIAALAESDAAIVKATEDQRLALLVKPNKINEVATELRAVGLGLRHYQDGLHQPSACIGKYCPEYAQDALASAMDLSQALAAVELDTPLRIGVNGCGRCCVPTHTLDISVVGEGHGYRISLGGKNSQIPEMATFMAEGVPAEELPKLITKVVEVYKDVAHKDETLQETMERFGSGAFINALAPYSMDAAVSDTDTGTSAKLEDPFHGLDTAAGSSSVGPMVEDHAHELAYDKEPQVEDFSDDRIAAAGSGPLAVEDVEPSTADTHADQVTETIDGKSQQDKSVPVHKTDGAHHRVEAVAPLSTPAEELIEVEKLALSVMAAEEASSLDSSLPSDHDFDEVLADFEEEMIAEESPVAAPQPKLQSLRASGKEPSQQTSAHQSGDLKSEVAMEESAKALEHEHFEDDYSQADELDGEAADQFESKLNASISEEEQHPPVEDLNSQSRLEAMRLVEASGPIHEDLHVEGGFNNLGIEDENPNELTDNSDAGASFQDQEQGFELVAMEFTPEGRLSIQFSTGAAIMLDPRTFKVGSRRELSIAGKKVLIMAQERGFSVEVDGIGVFAPAPKNRPKTDRGPGSARASKADVSQHKTSAGEPLNGLPRRRNA